MDSIVPAGADQLAVQQEALIQQFMQLTVQRQQVQQQMLDTHTGMLKKLFEKDRQRDLEYNLITINQLDTMIGEGWSEKVKNKKGRLLSAWCRKHHHPLKQIPHPSIPRGVKGYEPAAVKAWLEENGEVIPQELRYV